MKKYLLLSVFLLGIGAGISTQNRTIRVHRGANIDYTTLTSAIDSITFTGIQPNKSMNIFRNGNVHYSILTSIVDSITFVERKDYIEEITEIPLTLAMLSTNAQEPTEGSIANLVDRDSETFFHSKWSNAIALPHWIDVTFPSEINYDSISFRFQNRHNKDNNGPKNMQVFGSSDGKIFESLVEINGITANERGAEYLSEKISLKNFEVKYGVKPKILRFSVLSIPIEESWFSMAEFWLYGHRTTVVNPETYGIAEDVEVSVKSATASSSQNSEGIEKSYDDDYSSIYHSSYSGSLPITLTYTLENTSSLNHFVYYPRTDGNKNGIFKQIEVKVSTKAATSINMGVFDMPGDASPYRINFPIEVVDPVKVFIKVTASAGASASEENKYASCAEMKFFRKDSDVFHYSLYFTDASCSELKSDVTMEEIEKIEQPFFKQLAIEIFNGQYKKELRTQEYKAYRHPDIDATELKTSTYGLHDNPTGIFATQDEEIVVLLGDTHGQNISIFLQNPDKEISGVSFSVFKGINRFKAPFSGLLYVIYYTQTGEEPAIRVNITTGGINGYFDSSKHTKNDWIKLINAATFRHFDLIGQYASMTFETSALKQYVSDGNALIDQYDKLVYDQQEFMGLVKYNKQYKNRSHFQVMYGDGYMHASSYRTAYHANTQSEILNVNKLIGKNMTYSESIWGPAHELGHTHQTRPGLRWIGMAEVTNNIFSAHIQTKWTGKCRLQEEKIGNGNRYDKAFSEILDKTDANGNPQVSYIEHEDVFCRLIPFWQLKLYIVDVLAKTDFYKDIYEWVRMNPDLSSNAACQLQFVEFASKAANLDLTYFFTKWGFLKPLDLTIDDYGVSTHTVTQKMIDKTKAVIEKYPKPSRDFTRITDNNKLTYK